MKFCKIISKDNVIAFVLRLVQGAKEEIFVTMDVDEEKMHPLPEKYHRTISKKAKEGVKVIRYGFGSKKSYNRLLPLYSDLIFSYAGVLNNYQRVLIIDRHKGIFSPSKGIYFYSEFKPLIRALIKYTETVYNRKRV